MRNLPAAVFLFVFCIAAHAAENEIKTRVRGEIDSDLSYLTDFYVALHRDPELSFLEEKTAAKLASELKSAGYAVSEKVGLHGVVGVLSNGNGPTLLIRTDMDALPVKEQTGLAYASNKKQVNTTGEEVPVMHACGHDVHMSVAIGTARFLARNKDRFRGTVVIIGQSAEERGAGARAMLKAGLFSRFPKPNYCLALHVHSSLEAGKVAYVPGYMMANVDMVDITIRGVGGHGAYPHMAKDPVVLASETVLALQTLISREKKASDPGVLTVGSIHGGTKHNIIPDEVKLQLTLRSYSDAVRTNMIEGIKRVTRGLAIAAGLPEDRMPLVNVLEDEFTAATYNDPALTERWVAVLEDWLGKKALVRDEPQMGGEDFSEYGRTEEKIPICMLWLGSVSTQKMKEGVPPSIHSPFYHPDPEGSIRTGVTALSAAALDLLQKGP
jgi:amidohydrolase